MSNHSLKPKAETMRFVLLGVCRMLKVLFLAIFLGCSMALLYLFLRPELHPASILKFAQWTLAGGCYYVIAHLAAKAIVEASNNDEIFFKKQITRLRVVALLVLGLSIIATILSGVQAFLANGLMPNINFSLLPSGFPNADQWEAAFSTAPIIVSTPSVASIDLGALLAFILLWGLSSAFEQAASLQEESNLTL